MVSRYNFILTCKYSSHSYLADWIEVADAKLDLHERLIKRWDGKQRLFYRYRFANGVPIKDGRNALKINWMELAILDTEGFSPRPSFICHQPRAHPRERGNIR